MLLLLRYIGLHSARYLDCYSFILFINARSVCFISKTSAKGSVASLFHQSNMDTSDVWLHFNQMEPGSYMTVHKLLAASQKQSDYRGAHTMRVDGNNDRNNSMRTRRGRTPVVLHENHVYYTDHKIEQLYHALSSASTQTCRHFSLQELHFELEKTHCGEL